MVVDSLDSRFDFSDKDFLVDTYKLLCNTLLESDDNEILDYINTQPRSIGMSIKSLEKAEEIVKDRELIKESIPIPLEDRNDEWLADRRAEIRSEIAELARKEEVLKAERDSIDQEFMDRFAARGTSGTRTSRFTISIRTDDNYPEVEDREEFEKYLLETGKLYLLQKRLSLSSVKEELAAMEQEKAAILEELEEQAWSDDACIKTLKNLNEDNDLIDRKIMALKLVDKLVEVTKNDIEEHFSIPGVNIVSKLVVNQVKRG